jgi:outer membrane protein assembly factor BamB
MRSKTLLVLLATSAPIAIALASRHPGPPDSIATFRGDLAHTGVYRTAGVERFGGLQWRVQTGGMVESSPAVSGGVVYIGSGDGCLYALNALTGEERWRLGTGRFATGGRVRSSPAVAGGRVFVGSMDGTVYAVERWNGGSPTPNYAGIQAVAEFFPRPGR